MRTRPTISLRATIALATSSLLVSPIWAAPPPIAERNQVFTQQTPIATLHPGIASGTLRVSADGQRIAYMATLEGGGEAVFVNDEQSPKYGGIVNDSLSFSPDSQRVAWGALRDGKLAAVVDGQPGEPWDSVIRESFVFSPDSSRFAFVAKDGNAGRVIVDAKAGLRYRNVAGFTFSPDGNHFAYVAMFEQSMAIIVDGIEMATGRTFIKDTLRFDGPRTLHVVRLDGNQLIREQIDLIATSDGPKDSPRE